MASKDFGREPQSRGVLPAATLSEDGVEAVTWRDSLFEKPADALGRVNLWCSAIALVMVAGILGMWILTEIVR
jgi:hypothetical protein